MSDKINETEKDAMTGDKSAVILIVSSFRKYRKASEDLLSKRYRDGECDAVALIDFEYAIKEANEDITER